ncbi:reverse transcriptase domain-containing protein [Ornithinibacillus xuwenensis]|uniref:RNA-directed DNA polymerase n=1 Tax=Ornithinibacillus xuwenensis TaxID=3144668 RepID=A0ABU9XLQ4_9BACI
MISTFYPSITREKVFILFKNLGYNNYISNILTNICTIYNELPQGGVCSPYISNLVCYKLDRRLIGLCAKRDINYTRFADDLTFSSDNKDVLKKVKNVIIDILYNEGFEINRKKTRFLSPISYKKITGLTINHKNNKNKNRLTVNKLYKKKVRAMIHKAIFTGDYSEKNVILGYISYINSIESDFRSKIIRYVHKLIKNYKHLVDAYNNNKIFQELNNVEYKSFEEVFYEQFDYKNYSGLLLQGFTKEKIKEYEYINAYYKERISKKI